MVNVGEKIGPYEIHQLLGQGGMAAVYKVWNSDLHRYEALKTPLSQNSEDEFTWRFLRESRNAASLNHPHIAAIYNVSAEDAPVRYFTMELVEGGDLADLIYQNGRLSLQDTWKILQQVASALDHAHACGVWHRDIKPANILLQKTVDSGHFVKVVDFGISHAAEDTGGTRLTKTGMFIGTPEYMSPEQAGSEYSVDRYTDQYSLGVIAYEMLCGRPPFKAESDTSMLSVIIKVVRDNPQPPQELVPALSSDANAAILRILAKNPADRFETCAEFVNALVEPVAVKPPTVIPVIESPAVPVTEVVPPKEISFCPRCGNEIPDGIAFCPTCETTKSAVPPTLISALPENTEEKTSVPPEPRSTLLRNLMLTLAGVGVLLILLSYSSRPRTSPALNPGVPPSVHGEETPAENPPISEVIPKPSVPEEVKWLKLPDGEHYNGTVVNNIPNGKGVKFWPGNSRYEGNFKDGKRNGYGIMMWPDKSKFYGNFMDDEINGEGTLAWADRKQKGEWTQDEVTKVLSGWKKDADAKSKIASQQKVNRRNNSPQRQRPTKSIKSHPVTPRRPRTPSAPPPL